MTKKTESFTVWRQGDGDGFGRRPQLLRHTLAASPLFSNDAIARLIENSPRDRFHVNTMPRDATDPRKWREGEMSGVSGRDVLSAVSKGNLWVHLQRVQDTDPAYKAVLDRLFAEIAEHVPGFRSYKRSMSVLISSPRMNVALHSDMPGQSLWQVRGVKRVWIYPPTAPYLPQRTLEDIVLKRATDTQLPYDASFDGGALFYELKAGDWATWPRAAPHRVVNGDCVNVSFTTEHWTDALRAGYAVDYANGLLRSMCAGRDLDRTTQGPAFWGKLAVAAAHKTWRSARGATTLPMTVDFRVDPNSDGGFSDIAPYNIMK